MNQRAQLRLGARARAGRRRGAHRDDGLQLFDRLVGLFEVNELRCEAEPRAHFGHRRGEDASAPRARQQQAPRGGARLVIVQVCLLRFGDTLQKKRIELIARVQPLENRQRLLRLVLVPQIDELQLECRFAATAAGIYAFV